MKLHFADSATVRTRARLVSPAGGLGPIDLKVRYGVLEHPGLGPVLIDAGYSRRITSGGGRSSALRLYARVLSPQINPHAHPREVLHGLGYDIKDVRHVILTHLHADHLGYLDLFAHAEFHLGAHCAGWLGRTSRAAALRHGIFPELLPPPGTSRLRIFEASSPALIGEHFQGFDIFGDGSAIALALPGHASGHYGVHFPLLEAPLLYAADAAWTRAGLSCGAVAAQAISDNRGAGRETCARLARYAAAGGRIALCHDPDALPEDLAA